MDVTTQKCAICGLLRTDENSTPDKPWVRISGVALGNSTQPILPIRPQPNYPRQPNLNWQALDFCYDCSIKTTVNKVPGLYLVKTQPAAK